MLDALQVRQNAVRGFLAGLLLTAVVFVVFVVLPGATTRSPVYYVALAFVLAMATGGLVTVLLMLVRAYRLSREL
jgi:hypothetical protein